MDARQLAAFLAVVEHGTVTRAADATHVSQPALSQTIRSLEDELGALLFNRIRGRLSLTPAGEALTTPAGQVLRSLEVAERAVADVVGVAGGSLDLVVLPTLAVDPAAALVGRFRMAHPAVTVKLRATDGTEHALLPVQAGRAELALTDARAGHGLVVHVLGEQAYRAVFPPGGGPGRRRTIPVGALAGMPMVTTPVGTSTRLIVERAHELAGVAPVIAVEVGPRDAILPLVIAGAGATLLPAPLAAQAAALGADVRDIDPPLTRAVTLAHRDATLSPAAAAFVAMATG